jgi:hypothetical protein
MAASKPLPTSNTLAGSGTAVMSRDAVTRADAIVFRAPKTPRDQSISMQQTPKFARLVTKASGGRANRHASPADERRPPAVERGACLSCIEQQL